jgi:hypothetical protein
MAKFHQVLLLILLLSLRGLTTLTSSGESWAPSTKSQGVTFSWRIPIKMVSKNVWFINNGKSNLDDLGYPHDLGNLQLNFVIYGIYGRYKPRDLFRTSTHCFIIYLKNQVT